jgi:hypothetical protein
VSCAPAGGSPNRPSPRTCPPPRCHC